MTISYLFIFFSCLAFVDNGSAHTIRNNEAYDKCSRFSGNVILYPITSGRKANSLTAPTALRATCFHCRRMTTNENEFNKTITQCSSVRIDDDMIIVQICFLRWSAFNPFAWWINVDVKKERAHYCRVGAKGARKVSFCLCVTWQKTEQPYLHKANVFITVLRMP